MSKGNDEVKDDLMRKQKVKKADKIENKTVRVFVDVLEPDEKIVKSLSPVKWRVYFANLFKPVCLYFLFLFMAVVLYVVEGDGVSKADALFFLCFITGLVCVLSLIIILITKKSVKNIYYITSVIN